MKAIITERQYSDRIITGVMQDDIVFQAYDKDGNRFLIRYLGKQQIPENLYNYDIDIEVKIALIPKVNQTIVKEFK